MALNMKILTERLKKAFGDDSQEMVGKKLNMTQGNVSKILSGFQQPTLETIFHIAEAYGVSADWLLGISERKKSVKDASTMSYAAAIDALIGLKQHGAMRINDEGNRNISFVVEDPILINLIKKSLILSKTDRELYQNWRETRLAAYEDKPLIYNIAWDNSNVCFLASQASTESNWLKVYDAAKKAEEEFDEIMGDDPDPFDE